MITHRKILSWAKQFLLHDYTEKIHFTTEQS